MRQVVILTISVLFIGTNSHAQSSPIGRDSVVESLNLKIQNLNQKLDSFSSLRETHLEERLNQASETISGMSSLLSGFGTMYTIITIVIALIGIALPIITYQFGIKPSQKALKDLEENVDVRLNQFLFQERDAQINKAIEDVVNDNSLISSNAINVLGVNQYYDFSELQLYKIYKAIKSGKVGYHFISTLAYCLASKESDFAKDYFSNEILTSENAGIRYPAIKYFIGAGIENFVDVLSELSRKGPNEFYQIVGNANLISKEVVIKILNNSQIVESAFEGKIDIKQSILDTFTKGWKIPKDEFEATYFYKRIKEKTTSLNK